MIQITNFDCLMNPSQQFYKPIDIRKINKIIVPKMCLTDQNILMQMEIENLTDIAKENLDNFKNFGIISGTTEQRIEQVKFYLGL